MIAPGFAGTLIATVGPAPCFFINAASYGTRADLAAGLGWTDVARFGVHGIPAVNLRPGEAIEARQADESVALDDLSSTFDALKDGRRSRREPRSRLLPSAQLLLRSSAPATGRGALAMGD